MHLAFTRGSSCFRGEPWPSPDLALEAGRWEGDRHGLPLSRCPADRQGTGVREAPTGRWQAADSGKPPLAGPACLADHWQSPTSWRVWRRCGSRLTPVIAAGTGSASFYLLFSILYQVVEAAKPCPWPISLELCWKMGKQFPSPTRCTP